MKLQCSLKLIYFHQQSEPPTLPHTTAISLTPHSQSVSGLIRYKNLICQIREGRNVRGTAEAAGESTAGAGLGTGNGAGLVQHPLPCARGFPQAGTAGTIPLHPQLSLERRMVPEPGDSSAPRVLPGSASSAKPTPGKAQLCPHLQGSRTVHQDSHALLLHPTLPSLNSFSATKPRFAHLNQSSINILFKKNKPQMQTFTKRGRKVTVK